MEAMAAYDSCWSLPPALHGSNTQQSPRWSYVAKNNTCRTGPCSGNHIPFLSQYNFISAIQRKTLPKHQMKERQGRAENHSNNTEIRSERCNQKTRETGEASTICGRKGGRWQKQGLLLHCVVRFFNSLNVNVLWQNRDQGKLLPHHSSSQDMSCSKHGHMTPKLLAKELAEKVSSNERKTDENSLENMSYCPKIKGERDSEKQEKTLEKERSGLYPKEISNCSQFNENKGTKI